MRYKWVEFGTLFISLLLMISSIDGTIFFKSFFYRRTVYFRENEACSNGLSKAFAIIVHGWRENCDAPWALNLTENLEKYRSGCIMCMDYRFFAKTFDYFKLARHMNDIAIVLTEKLEDLANRGFDPNQGFLFGFSLGGRIVLEAGRRFGKRRIAEIDVCDMAGPGFDRRPQPDPKDAAQNVQCIHTSKDKGTLLRQCHQDWNMGHCGQLQDAASQPPFGSHSLCPRFYNIAFESDFLAETVPLQCPEAKKTVPFIPFAFKMGYMEDRKQLFQGNFYASTTKSYPFTATAGLNTNIKTLQAANENSVYQNPPSGYPPFVVYFSGQTLILNRDFYNHHYIIFT